MRFFTDGNQLRTYAEQEGKNTC